eukprot:16381748-Heterocapsa_arctica.AAC.1
MPKGHDDETEETFSCNEQGRNRRIINKESVETPCEEQRKHRSRREETVIGSKRAHQSDVAQLAEHGIMQQRVGGHHGAGHPNYTRKRTCMKGMTLNRAKATAARLESIWNSAQSRITENLNNLWFS